MTALFDWLTDAAQPTRTPGMMPPYLYRYMGADGLLFTVHDQALRMNTWSQMNDPREAKEWAAGPTLRAAGEYTDEELAKRFDSVMRRSARLMSLSDDRKPQGEDARPFLFHRGWARAAQWSHYADGHRGVCLVLDWQELADSLMGMPPVDGRYTTWGGVTYVDEPIDAGLAGNYESQAALDAAIEAMLDKRHAISRLHMTKNKDWSYEREVRVVTIDVRAADSDLDTALSVPLGDALVGVIFGDAHPAPALVAGGITAVMGPLAPEMFRCTWVGGAPQLSPLPFPP